MAINKLSLTDQLYDMIKEQIVEQEIRSGEQINPKTIADQHGISVMPVRDALLKLVNDGLVVNKPRVGFFVRSFSREEIKEIMETRKMFELYCLNHHFASIDITEVKKLKEILDSGKNLSRKEIDELDSGIHKSIIYASDNDYLIETYNQSHTLFFIFRFLKIRRFYGASQQHKDLVDAILAGDRDRTEQVLIQHLDQVMNSILESSNYR